MTQETAAALRSLKRDLALCAIMSAGNDYLPSVPGGGLSAKEGKPSLWGTYPRPARRQAGLAPRVRAPVSLRGDLPRYF